MRDHSQTVFLVCCLLAAATTARSGVPDLAKSYVTCAFTGPGYATVMNVPNGSGDSFDRAHLDDGTLVNATITLTLRDGAGYPIANYPRDDLFLISLDSGMVPCIQGTIADHDTDANGQTIWRNPLRAGGFSLSGCQVSIAGSVLPGPELPVRFVSPDIDGDLMVNLYDLSLFAQDYYGLYNFHSDFFHDGKIDLKDISRLASAIGTQCP